MEFHQVHWLTLFQLQHLPFYVPILPSDSTRSRDLIFSCSRLSKDAVSLFFIDRPLLIPPLLIILCLPSVSVLNSEIWMGYIYSLRMFEINIRQRNQCTEFVVKLATQKRYVQYFQTMYRLFANKVSIRLISELHRHWGSIHYDLDCRASHGNTGVRSNGTGT